MSTASKRTVNETECETVDVDLKSASERASLINRTDNLIQKVTGQLSTPLQSNETCAAGMCNSWILRGTL